MGFFHSDMKNKLPLRGRKKLPLRGKRARRLKLLRQFEVGRVYTFPEYFRLDVPEDWPEDLLLEETHDHYRNC